jgi:hypothetical protein
MFQIGDLVKSRYDRSIALVIEGTEMGGWIFRAIKLNTGSLDKKGYTASYYCTKFDLLTDAEIEIYK